ncbi:MAG TPA: DUF2231 domain-containing protein [Actinomycetota bacterium]|jgi:uncharacterized membrane protein|nr:DUF2231 domain-containing protein [Actinomycetota bacterium]
MLNPFALPVHPAIVHFPVAMLSAAWVCLLVRYATGDERWDGRSRLFELVGVVALPLTIATAFIDTRGIGFLLEPRTDAPLIWHMAAGLVTAGAFTAHYLWRRRLPVAGDVALATLGMIALVAAGLLAGEMVFGT